MPGEGGPSIEIRQPRPEEMAAVRTLRQEELNNDEPLDQPVEPTEADQDTRNLHMAAFHGDRVVGAVRVDPLAEPPDTHYVSRMVTRKEYRGQGVGARHLTLDSRPQAEGFYAKAGYVRAEPQPDPEHVEI